jgi:hypothetical protein
MMLRTVRNFSLAILIAATALSAADPLMGTWKVNTAKSKYNPGPGPQRSTVVYSQDGEWIVSKFDVVDSGGKPVSYTNRWKRDGKEYPFESPIIGRGTISLKRVGDFHLEGVIKAEGDRVVTTRSVISKDGKTRTMTVTGTDAKGQKIHNVIVYEKQ